MKVANKAKKFKTNKIKQSQLKDGFNVKTSKDMRHQIDQKNFKANAAIKPNKKSNKENCYQLDRKNTNIYLKVDGCLNQEIETINYGCVDIQKKTLVGQKQLDEKIILSHKEIDSTQHNSFQMPNFQNPKHIANQISTVSELRDFKDVELSSIVNPLKNNSKKFNDIVKPEQSPFNKTFESKSCTEFNNEVINNEVMFFPSTPNFERLKNIMQDAEKSLDICMYLFTDFVLAKHLIEIAKTKNIEIRVIINTIPVVVPAKHIQSNIIRLLMSQTNIKIRIAPFMKTRGVLHHKFWVRDKSLSVTGSYNFTGAAKAKNNENVVILWGDLDAANKFSQEFDLIWEKSDIPLMDKPKNPIITPENKHQFLDARLACGFRVAGCTLSTRSRFNSKQQETTIIKHENFIDDEFSIYSSNSPIKKSNNKRIKADDYENEKKHQQYSNAQDELFQRYILLRLEDANLKIREGKRFGEVATHVSKIFPERGYKATATKLNKILNPPSTKVNSMLDLPFFKEIFMEALTTGQKSNELTTDNNVSQDQASFLGKRLLNDITKLPRYTNDL
jgi:hypothetical protein